MSATQPQRKHRNHQSGALHREFGITHITLGAIILGLEIAGILTTKLGSSDRHLILASGIWCGTFLLIAGIVQLSTGIVKDQGVCFRCLLRSLVIVDTLTVLLVLIGGVFCVWEVVQRLNLTLEDLGNYRGVSNGSQGRVLFDPSNIVNTYNLVKSGFILVVCIVTFNTLIVHAGFTCSQACCHSNSNNNNSKRGNFEVSPEAGVYYLNSEFELTDDGNNNYPPSALRNTTIAITNGDQGQSRNLPGQRQSQHQRLEGSTELQEDEVEDRPADSNTENHVTRI